jgi:hypothetical protein
MTRSDVIPDFCGTIEGDGGISVRSGMPVVGIGCGVTVFAIAGFLRGYRGAGIWEPAL